MLSTIRERRVTIFGHLLKHKLCMTKIFERQINRHKGRERPSKTHFIEKMIKHVDCNRYVNLKRLE